MFVHFALCLVVPAFAAIYGTDDRVEVRESNAARLAPSVAVLVPGALLAENADHFSFEAESMHAFDLCQREKFKDQYSMGNCTGFLVGPRILVTAGHCQGNTGINSVADQYCAAFSWVFDYNLRDGKPFAYNEIPADKVYRCVRSLRNEFIENFPYDLSRVGTLSDFSVIELDRDVEGAEPLILGASPRQNGEEVFTIGHPWGLPAKYSGLAQALRTESTESFGSTLDTLSGNSGGPVFNERLEVVGILIGGHQNDTDQGAQCVSLNRCDEGAENCSAKSQLFPFSDIQRIESVLRYLPVRTEAGLLRNQFDNSRQIARGDAASKPLIASKNRR